MNKTKYAPLALGLLVACGGADGNVQVEVDTASVEQGIAVTCTNDTGTLRVESVRIHIDQEVEFDDGPRSFVRALRVMDSGGHTFSIVSEGDTPAEWIEHDNKNGAEAIKQQHYDLARNCRIKVLESELIMEGDRQWIAARLETFADLEMEPEYLDEETVQNLRVEDEGQSSQALLFDWGPSKSYVQTIDSYWKYAFDRPPFHHTATITRRYVWNGRWVFSGDQAECNHGACPWQSGMQWYSYKVGPITNTPVRPQKCSGPYSMPHLCNNDTLLQQSNIVFNRKYNTQTAPQCMYNRYYRP